MPENAPQQPDTDEKFDQSELTEDDLARVSGGTDQPVPWQEHKNTQSE